MVRIVRTNVLVKTVPSAMRKMALASARQGSTELLVAKYAQLDATAQTA